MRGGYPTEMMAKRGIEVDHSTVHRRAIKLLPVLEKGFSRCKHPVGKNWGVDEIYVKVRGTWKYLYHAGNTVDFLLNRDKEAARRYFEKAIAQNCVPETVTIDKSGANLAGLYTVNAERETPIKIRQTKYLNNIVEQDHRAIKRRTRPMLGFKDFRRARILLSGIELMHMIAKGQMKDAGNLKPPALVNSTRWLCKPSSPYRHHSPTSPRENPRSHNRHTGSIGPLTPAADRVKSS